MNSQARRQFRKRILAGCRPGEMEGIPLFKRLETAEVAWFQNMFHGICKKCQFPVPFSTGTWIGEIIRGNPANIPIPAFKLKACFRSIKH